MDAFSIPAYTLESQQITDPYTGEILSPEGGLILKRNNSSQFCTHPPSFFLKAINPALAQVVYFRPRCKRRGCPYCENIHKWYWVRTATLGSCVFLEQGVALDFLTITSHEKLGAAGSFAVLGHAWDLLLQRVRRKAENRDYFAIPEQHQDGRWHMHAIITARLPKKWWKDNARAVGFGYQSDVKEVKNERGVVGYVSKYLGKTLQNSNLPKHFRAVRTSRDWPMLPELPLPEGWRFVAMPKHVAVNEDMAREAAGGLLVVLADSESAWDWIQKP